VLLGILLVARNAPRMHSSFGNNRIFSKSNSSFMAPSFHGNGCHMIAPIGSRSFSTGRKVKIVVLQQRVLKSFAKTAKYIVTACCVGINESSFSTVYVLQLKHGKKYVGYWSGDFAKCLKIHFSGHASKVTKKNPPDGCVVVLQQRVPKSFAQTAKYIVTACFVGIHGPDRVSGARISRSYSISRELKRFFGHHIAFGTPLGRSVIAAVRKWLPAKGTSKPSNKK
jgi:predicted GIY-YIG superfamily endonuclease